MARQVYTTLSEQALLAEVYKTRPVALGGNIISRGGV
jgi:hypothetical protein